MNNIDFGLNGKRALVTGGSHGIGLAVAHLLLRHGCSVTILSRDRARLDSAVDELSKHNVPIHSIQCDVLSPKECKLAVSDLLERWSGGVDVLVNNVGGGGRWGKENVLETDELVWTEVFQKNTGAQIYFTNSLLPGMIAKKWGRVVTISSLYGKSWWSSLV